MRVAVLKKSFLFKLSAIFLCCLFVASVAVYFRYDALAVFASGRKVPVYSVDTDKRVVSLTFDAAWGADKTKGILDILDSYGIKATFFLVGFWVDNFPDMVKEIDARGHEIGTHSETHPHMPKLTAEKMTEELKTSSQKITAITGKSVEIFRPPFGDYNNTLIEVCEAQNIIPIQWDVDSLDWKGYSAAVINKRVTDKVKNGSIVLFHNNSGNILEALPLVIETLKLKGFSFEPVGNVIYKQNYTVDNNGVQHKNDVQ